MDDDFSQNVELQNIVNEDVKRSDTSLPKEKLSGTRASFTGSLKHSYPSLTSAKNTYVKDIVNGSGFDRETSLSPKTSAKDTTSVLFKTTSIDSGTSKRKMSLTSIAQNYDSQLKKTSTKSGMGTLSKLMHPEEISVISSSVLNIDKTNTVKKCGRTPTVHKSVRPDTVLSKGSSSNYISPWAKSSDKTLSNLSTNVEQIQETSQQCGIRCIPPWAKSLRNCYGITPSDPSEGIPQGNLQEKIKSLMEKHSRLMLVKRGESRKQLIIKPGETGEMGTVKMASTNTRYYMTPIPRDLEDDLVATSSEKKSSIRGSVTMSLTKKTSKSQAKTEVADALKSLYNSKTQKETMHSDQKLTKQQTNCLKITPSQVRDYVNSKTQDNDARQLHEIIKIKKVPSYSIQSGGRPSSKYIINVPTGGKGAGATVNKITVKEKRKIRIDSVEDVNENVTEIIYNKNDSKTKEKVQSQYTKSESVEEDVVPYSKHRKSPTKSKTLKVTAETTPIISDFLKKEERDRDKIMLIQYEKKSKPCQEKSEAEKPTMVSTQLLGIRQPYNDTSKEMYLYGTETDGKTCKEKITQIDDVSPTLREKVNMIFQELREMTFKPCAELEPTATEELQPSVCSKGSQHPSALVQTDAVSVQAYPEVRSAEVQVHDSVSRLLPAEPLDLQSTVELLAGEEDKERTSGDKVTVSTVTKQLETETRLGKRLDSIQPTDTKLFSAIEEKEEVTGIDDVEFLEPVEKEGSEEKKYSQEDIDLEENIDLRKSETQDLREEETKTDEKEEKTAQDYGKEQIDEDDKNLDGKTYKEPSVEERAEALELEETLATEEKKTTRGRSSKHDVTKDEQHLSAEDLKDEKDTTVDKKVEKSKEEKEEQEAEKKEVSSKDHLRVKDSMEQTEIAESEAGYEYLKDFDEKSHILMEDIRSYDFDPEQEADLKMISSSKFFHQRDSLRKLHWTEDTLYLHNNTCPQLIKALAEIAVRQPEDPISYLAHFIYKEYHNRESDEQQSVYKEHLEVAKGMMNTKKDEQLVPKKFGLRRYPKKTETDPSVDATTSETSPITESIKSGGES